MITVSVENNKKTLEETLYDIYSDPSLCVVCEESLSRINVLLSQYGVKGRVKQDKNGTFILQIIKIGE